MLLSFFFIGKKILIMFFYVVLLLYPTLGDLMFEEFYNRIDFEKN